MQETKEQIRYDMLANFKGYMRMPREVQRSRRLSANAKDLAAMLFSFSNTKKKDSTCTRTYKEFAEELNVSCATVSRALKKIKDVFPGAVEQVCRATYKFDPAALASKSYIISENYLKKYLFTFKDGTKRRLSRYAAQAAAAIYEQFFDNSLSWDLEHDKRAKFNIHAPVSVANLAKWIGRSEKIAAKALAELIDCKVIFLKGLHKQLNGYFCRDFKPELKLFEAIREVRAMKQKSYDLAQVKYEATEAEKNRQIIKDEKIRRARQEHAEEYQPLLDKHNHFIDILVKERRELTADESLEWSKVTAKIRQLDEYYANSE